MSSTQMMCLTRAVAGCLAMTVLSAPACAADEEPDSVKKFKKFVESEAKTILRVAHPLGKYKDIAFDSYKKSGEKHELAYTINWTGKEKKEEKDFATTFTFTVQFDKDDEIDELEIAVSKDTCPSKAFKGANIAAAVFRAQVKNTVTAVIDDKELLEKIDKMDADGLLAVWLKYVNRKPKK